MKLLQKLVFFGTEEFSLPSLIALHSRGYDIVAVVTKPDSARGRSKQLVAPVVKEFALAHKIPVFQPKRLATINDDLKALEADAAILVSYGKILPKPILDIFEPIGIINIHPSLLPRYRGPSPIEAAIINGDSQTGISIMKLNAAMDEGPLYSQIAVQLRGNETRRQLSSELAGASARHLIEILPGICAGNIKTSEQKNDDVSYTSLLSKDMGHVDPLTDTAESIERSVRAYLDFPKTRLTISNIDVILTSVKIVQVQIVNSLTIACAENTYLQINKLIAPSGKTMSGEAFIRGYKV
jgi:methionyl-tRNA formyltransferase